MFFLGEGSGFAVNCESQRTRFRERVIAGIYSVRAGIESEKK